MYRATDTFQHERHVVANGGTESCAVCHPDPGAAKNRTSSKACDSCHVPAPQTATLVRSSEATTLAPGLAPGYKLAMHGLCVNCHAAEQDRRDELARLDVQARVEEQTRREAQASIKSEDPYLVRCTTCHRGAFADEVELRRRTGWGVATVSLSAPVRARSASSAQSTVSTKMPDKPSPIAR
jgi:hypothetical protein